MISVAHTVGPRVVLLIDLSRYQAIPDNPNQDHITGVPQEVFFTLADGQEVTVISVKYGAWTNGVKHFLSNRRRPEIPLIRTML